jgi:heavy metal translocating P-type ATPase
VVHRYQDGRLASPPLEEVRPGDRLLVKPGEVVPVDGLVQGPTAVLDESALTGEAELVERGEGDRVRSGVVNAGSPFDLRATTTAATSTYAGILRLVSEAQASRAPLARLADRYALAFVPLTLAVAGAAWLGSGEATRALAVLVVATPCPLILAVPVAIVAGISRAARRGIVVKSGTALERLAAGRVLLFDKTGTLTAGAPVVAEVQAVDRDGDELLGLAASLDQVSQHVLAGAIVRAASGRQLPLVFPADVKEEPGRGVRGRVGGHGVAVGKAAWAAAGQPLPSWARRLRRRGALEGFSTVFVAVDDVLAGALAIHDPVRPDAARTLRQLRRAGLQRVVLVTGDHPDVAELVGAAVGVDEVLAERSPAEKLEAARIERAVGPTIMVCDGINDAPALAAADVGVAMGAVAGAVVQEAIDVAVIANALRALGAGRARRRRPSAASVALGQRFRAEHQELVGLLDRVRDVADRIGRLSPPLALAEVTAVHRFLVERLLPHEEAEDRLLYPLVAELLGGEDPTAPMSRAHAEIAHLTRLLGGVLADLGPAGPEAEDLTDLRRILYGIHAILRLHFAQEEEAYLSLLDPGSQAHATSA